MMKYGIFALSCAAVCAVALSGCVPVAVGAGATIGVAAAQEGGVRGAATDTAIRLQITDLWLKHSLDMYRYLALTVKEGRVLITGSVPSADMRVDAVRLAWQADGVQQVINEIQVEGGSGIGAYVTDSWVTSSLKTQLTLDKYIQSINYSVETVNGTVYLMGVAQDQKELNRVMDYARNTKYVKNVISYVRLRGETPAGVLSPVTGDVTSGQDQRSWESSAPAPSRGGVSAVEVEELR